MKNKYILSLDAGTTSNRAIIFDASANIMAISQKEFEQIYPQPGWVEHNAEEIWSTQYEVMQDCLSKAKEKGIEVKDIAGIGITNQRETVVVWDKRSGEPICNAIVWQDRRTAYICELLKEKGLADYIQENTGLVVDAYFSGTKIKYILDNIEGARELAEEGHLAFGTVDSWLIWKLTEGTLHITDYTNASRTMIYNIKTLDWDDKLLQALDIPRSMLPEVRNSSEIYGHSSCDLFGEIQIPIAGIAGDQQAALFGQACFKNGMVKNTYGTGCFILMNIGSEAKKSENNLLTTIAWGLNGKIEYAFEGAVFIGGAVIQWLRDEMMVIDSAKETEDIAFSVADTEGVYVVPAFVGLGAPYWDMYARGSIQGITRGFNKKHLVRAALESIAYQSRDVIECMRKDSGLSIPAIKVDGGASVNDFLMHFQADIMGIDVSRPHSIETTALGSAFLSGLAVGLWSSQDEIAQMLSVEKTFSPQIGVERREVLYAGWKKAVGRSMEWEDEAPHHEGN